MKTLLWMILSVCVSGYFLFGPTTSTTLHGTITDQQSGWELAGASILITRGADLIGTITTDSKGKFQTEILPGTYTVEVSLIGYETAKIEGVEVRQGKVNVFNCALKAELILNQLSENAPTEEEKMVQFVPPVVMADVEMAQAPAAWRKRAANAEFNKDRVAPPSEYSPEQYGQIIENQFIKSEEASVSTFSIDVDGASYANARRFLNSGQLPPKDAVRLEEFVNYFDYKYKQPTDGRPFSVQTELARCPWNPEHQLLSIALQGRDMETGQLPPSNFVFLVDVSGSMNEENKLPLVKSSLNMLADYLRPQDRVAIVVYAGAAGLVLPSTSGNQKEKIKKAIDALEAGGSTAGAAGINLAYFAARKSFVRGGNNRVVLCTDGDFNVGVSSDADLVKMIEKERQTGIYLSVLGFGTGNYQDGKMQQLADKGNGNHSYIDQLSEAKKVLINEFGGTLFTIAKDVKIQLDFNKEKVAAYRLIGYENRLLNKEDFDDDTKDAGELGAGHRVTALYEIVQAGQLIPMVDQNGHLKYQESKSTANSTGGDLLTLKLRYKKPTANAASELIQTTVANVPSENMSENLTLAAAAASFGMVLRNSTYKGNATLQSTLKMAQTAAKNDPNGYRTEFCRLIKLAQGFKAMN